MPRRMQARATETATGTSFPDLDEPNLLTSPLRDRRDKERQSDRSRRRSSRSKSRTPPRDRERDRRSDKRGDDKEKDRRRDKGLSSALIAVARRDAW